MADVKNFGLKGVNADLQMGKGGGRILWDGSKYLMTTDDGSTLAELRVGAPTNDQSSASKAYVDSVASGLDPKESVQVASTGDLEGTYAAGSFTAVNTVATIDGYTLQVGDRVLLKDQTGSANENGIYEVLTVHASTGTLDRAADQDGTPANEVSAGNFCFVENGTANADTGWVLQGSGIITLDTDPLNWVQFSGAGSFTDGDGLTKTGNVLDLDFSASGGMTAAAATAGADLIAFSDNTNSDQMQARSWANVMVDLDIMNDIGGNGIVVRTAAGVASAVTLAVVADGNVGAGLALGNANGTGGDPTFSLDFAGTSSGTLETEDIIMVADGTTGVAATSTIADILAFVAAETSDNEISLIDSSVIVGDTVGVGDIAFVVDTDTVLTMTTGLAAFGNTNITGTGTFTTSGLITGGTLKATTVVQDQGIFFSTSDGTLDTDALFLFDDAANTNTGLLTVGAITVAANDINVTSGDLTLAAGDIHLTLGGLNVDGAAGFITVDTGNITATAGDLITTSGNVNITTGGLNVDGAAGFITVDSGDLTLAAGDIHLTLGGLNVDGAVGFVTVDSGDITATAGDIIASAGNVNITLGGLNVDGAAGFITVDTGDLTLTAGDIAVTAGGVIAGGEIQGDQLKSDGLTVGRVTYAGTAGILEDDAAFTYTTTNDVLTVGDSTTGGFTFTGTGQTIAGLENNADINIVPAGTGEVIIGSSGDATLSSESLFSMTLEGKVDLFLQSGTGDVYIQDKSTTTAETTAQFTANTDSTVWLQFFSDTAANGVSIGLSDGAATNADITFLMGSTSLLLVDDASSYATKIDSAADDAALVTKGWVDSAITSGASEEAVKSMAIVLDLKDYSASTASLYVGTAAGVGTVAVDDGGYGYTVAPVVIQDTGPGINGVFTAAIDGSGTVTLITGTGGGSLYDGTETFSLEAQFVAFDALPAKATVMRIMVDVQSTGSDVITGTLEFGYSGSSTAFADDTLTDPAEGGLYAIDVWDYNASAITPWVTTGEGAGSSGAAAAYAIIEYRVPLAAELTLEA